MDKLDKEFFPLLGSYEIGTTYYLKDILLPPTEMDRFVNRLYIFAKRKYLIIHNPDVYAELMGKPNWYNMSFKILANSYIQKYYLKETSKQLKLDL